MRVPLSWLHDYVDPGLTAEQLADLLTFGGLEVEAVLRPSAGVRGVKVAEVAAVERLQGSDKLRVVEAFDGQRTWEVVAGAANYRLGDKVPLATPGAALPGGITVGRKQLFGRVSNGMLASAAELGVGDDHRGIWILDDDAPLGAELADWLALDDAVLDVSVTPDRGYALSVIGLGCDVAALTGAELRLPDAEAPTGDPGVPVTIVDPDRCRRFDARTIRGVRVARSPAWLQRRLFAAGMRPVSNIVDATNHAMLETGNPVHAYDLALLAGPRIEVRTARPGEMLVTLDGVERILDPDDLVIADADGPVALAGVMGGEATEINDATADVLLEVANFSARTVLRSARRHRLVTEGSLRWERTVPAETTTLAATRCAALITQTAGGTVVGGADHYTAPTAPITIPLRPQRARDHLGMEVDDDRQRQLLRSIACEVVAEQDGTFTVVAPAYRPDLVEEADLYEEIARLHGYDRVPESVPSSGTVGGRGREDA
ncbi:MAG: phenylalanine--tRNA ligase subunit beta, partial [Actinomycetota bacterium]|nr:phenylalanine--tRNA ligase subunit beta [Actinomycetota bacterium]